MLNCLFMPMFVQLEYSYVKWLQHMSEMTKERIQMYI
jgi:hypothetical protein